MSEAKRVVLDTNQIVSAGTAWIDPLLETMPNDARSVVKAVAREHTGLYSGAILAEYVEKLLERGPKKRVGDLIGLLIGAFELVIVTSETCNPSPADPDDVMFITCAIDGGADLLVSDDSDLLVLKQYYDRPQIACLNEAKTLLL